MKKIKLSHTVIVYIKKNIFGFYNVLGPDNFC